MWVSMWDKIIGKKNPLQKQGLNSIFGGSGDSQIKTITY